VTAILLALLLQAPPAQATVELPVSLERIRAGLARQDPFEIPPRAWRVPVFRTRVSVWTAFDHLPWEAPTTVPLWVRPSTPPVHFRFLESTTPEEVRASAAQTCCNITPAVGAVTGFVKKQIRAARERSARREVEEAMRAAGIRR
jgi:hypothetical protein